MFRLGHLIEHPQSVYKIALQHPIRSSLYNSSCYLKAEMNASRNIWAFSLCDLNPMNSKNRRSYQKPNSHGLKSKTVNYNFSRFLFGWTTSLSDAEIERFSKILWLHEEELFYLQMPVRSRVSRDDINHCSYEDVNDYELQLCDNLEDTFDEIEDMLEGRKGWGDYFDDDVHTDGSDISDGDPCNIDPCSQFRSGEIESCEMDELDEDCEIGTEDDYFDRFGKVWGDYFGIEEGWGDYFVDCVDTDVSEISDGDPCNIDHCLQYHYEEIESSETDEPAGFQDCEIGTEDDEEIGTGTHEEALERILESMKLEKLKKLELELEVEGMMKKLELERMKEL